MPRTPTERERSIVDVVEYAMRQCTSIENKVEAHQQWDDGPRIRVIVAVEGMTPSYNEHEFAKRLQGEWLRKGVLESTNGYLVEVVTQPSNA